MKRFKALFVAIITGLIVMTIFLLADIVLAGLAYFVIQFFNSELASQVFKWGVAILFVVESALTIPAVVKTVKEIEGEE